jgi:glycosyltransferase involved in cell wall biosynthesis
MRLERRGKGLAIREAWRRFPADVAVFMDADLSTDLEALPDLVGAIGAGADLAIGSRYHPRSTVERSVLRRFVSRCYRFLLRLLLGTSVADVPCGFKAASARVVRGIVPKIKDDGWFFDTELVVRVERAGMRIAEVPVRWCDFRVAGRQSKVRVLPIGWEYFKKSLALRSELIRK